MSIHNNDDLIKKSNKALVVYYSLTNNTKIIAKTIQKEINCDILEIKPIKDLNPEGGAKFMWGGMQATMHKKPKLEPYIIDISKYEIIIIGTPVWAWTFAPPIRTFLSENDLKNRKIALWVCASGDGEKALMRFKKQLKDANLIGGMKVIEPTDKNMESNIAQTIEWVNSIKNQ